jgi:hypothetical protein
MEAICADVGLDTVPAGISKLTRKQRDFTLAYLRTGNASEAARLAGYSDPGSDGVKVQKMPEVAAVLAQAALPVAKNAEQIIRRVSERSRIAHHMVEREMAKPETTRSNKTLREWMDVANKADALLGTLLGKIQGVHISGEVKHAHTHTHNGSLTVIPAEALPAFAEIRRAVVQERIQTATIGGNN